VARPSGCLLYPPTAAVSAGWTISVYVSRAATQPETCLISKESVIPEPELKKYIVTTVKKSLVVFFIFEKLHSKVQLIVRAQYRIKTSNVDW